MASFNKAILIGHLVADPELKTTTNGVTVTQFRIGVSRKFDRNTSDFIDVVAWRQTAEFICKHFAKGKPILVCGSLQTRTYEDNSGTKKYVTEVVADEAAFVESKGENTSADSAKAFGGTNGAPSFNNASTAKFEEVTDDDNLPF